MIFSVFFFFKYTPTKKLSGLGYSGISVRVSVCPFVRLSVCPDRVRAISPEPLNVL